MDVLECLLRCPAWTLTDTTQHNITRRNNMYIVVSAFRGAAVLKAWFNISGLRYVAAQGRFVNSCFSLHFIQLSDRQPTTVPGSVPSLLVGVTVEEQFGSRAE